MSNFSSQREERSIDLCFVVEDVRREANPVEPAFLRHLHDDSVAIVQAITHCLAVDLRGQNDRDERGGERSRRRTDKAQAGDLAKPGVESVSQRNDAVLDRRMPKARARSIASPRPMASGIGPSPAEPETNRRSNSHCGGLIADDDSFLM
jgi:hypothetical protein